MSRLIKSTALTLLAIACVACGTETVTPKPETAESETVELLELEGVLWRLIEYADEAGGMSPVLEGTTVDIEFEGSQMGGSSGCNRYFGSYTLEEGNRLTFDAEIGSTQMACPPEIMEQESRYQELLGQVAIADRFEDHLILLEEGGELSLLIFVASQPAALENTDWQATGINNGKGGVVSSAATPMATARFSEGQITGSGGCNSFTASYELDGDRVTIGPAAATRKFCNEPEGIMDQEQQYFEALSRATTYSLMPERLELRDDSGSLQVGLHVAAE